jgi:aspartate-semialdehyde dehydrogenase
LGTERGFVAAKPNCSIKLRTRTFRFSVSTVSSRWWPAPIRPFPVPARPLRTGRRSGQHDPVYRREDEKSEQEPLRIWGRVENGVVVPAVAL